MCSRLCLGILIFLIGVVDIVTAVAAIVLGAWNHPLTWAFAVVMGIAVPMILLSTALMCWPVSPSPSARYAPFFAPCSSRFRHFICCAAAVRVSVHTMFSTNVTEKSGLGV